MVTAKSNLTAAKIYQVVREALDNLGHAQWRHDAARVVTGEDRRKGGFSEVP
jgi:formate-dependent nitrite reductase cytochrome c552 subunit